MRIFLFTLLILKDSISDSYGMWSTDTKASTTKDMSKTCVNNLEENVYLPYGTGTADALVLIISNRFSPRRCSIMFHKEALDEDIMKIIILEFLNDASSNLSYVCDDGNVHIIENYVNSVDLCQLFNLTQYQNPFIFTTRFDVKIQINDLRKNKIQAIKITATSTRKLKKDETCSLNELMCDLNSTKSCISVDLQCDGNVNCGHKNFSDEDQKICKTKSRKSLLFVISLSIVIGGFLIYSFVYRIRKWSPKLRKHLRMRYKSEENTIVLSSYTPAVKTYIPKTEMETLHLRVASTTDSSSQSDEGFLQAGFYKIKNQGGRDASPILRKKKR